MRRQNPISGFVFSSLKLAFLCVALSSFVLSPIGSLQWSVPDTTQINAFGSPVLFPDGAKSKSIGFDQSGIYDEKAKPADSVNMIRFAQSEITILNSKPQINADEGGKVVFFQRDGANFSGLPTPLGGVVAIAHPDNFMTVYSGISTQPRLFPTEVYTGDALGEAAGSGVYSAGTIGIQVFDVLKNVWANPIQFISGLIDEVRPDIVELALSSRSGNFVHASSDAGSMNMPQGSYEAALLVKDFGLSKSDPTSVFRVKLLVDGQEKINKSLSLAVPTAEGLSFFGEKPPSADFIDAKGRFVLAQVFLPRGLHQIDVSAADYAGNSAHARFMIAVN